MSKTRAYEFINGPETATLPTAGTPSASGDLTTVDSLNKVFGASGNPRNITAAVGIISASGHMSTTALRQVIFANGSGAAIDISANPQIQAHTIIGAQVHIIGTSDTNTLQLDDGNGLSLNGPAVLGQGYAICLLWDGAKYEELWRKF